MDYCLIARSLATLVPQHAEREAAIVTSRRGLASIPRSSGRTLIGRTAEERAQGSLSVLR
jgi:hypothetical protein